MLSYHRLSRYKRIQVSRICSIETENRSFRLNQGFRRLVPRQNDMLASLPLSKPRRSFYHSTHSTLTSEHAQPSSMANGICGARVRGRHNHLQQISLLQIQPSLSTQPSQRIARQHIRFNTAYASSSHSANQQSEQEHGIVGYNSSDQTRFHDTQNNTQHSKLRPEKIAELTRRLLSASPSSSSFATFEKTLASARTDKSIIKTMLLSPDDASTMFILPPDLLKDVHTAIMYFSKKEHAKGITLPEVKAVNEPPQHQLGGVVWKEEEDFTTLPTGTASSSTKAKQTNNKVPGPKICAQLLQLIGIPHYQLSNNIPPEVVVHSSQVDLILECCLQTTLALARSCESGRYSLIGSDFNFLQNSTGDNMNNRNSSSLPPKYAAQLAEEIWRSVWNLQIKYTSGRRKTYPPITPMEHEVPSQIRIGRIGIIGTSHETPMTKYLSATRRENVFQDEVCRGSDANGDYIIAELPSVPVWTAMTSESNGARLPWSARDQRRYDKSVILFNSVLAAYAKSSASASAIRSEVRKDMLQSAERLLLEVASTKRTTEPSPSTILQCLQPDAISFNTTILAWSAFSPRQGRNTNGQRVGSNSGLGQFDDQESRYIGTATATAHRTESILKMMQDLWDEERSTRNTLQSIQAAWEEHGYQPIPHDEQYAPPPSCKTIAPNISSYNTVLKAWSRSHDPEAAVQALKVYQTLLNRANIACVARESLVLENSTQQSKLSQKSKSHREGDAFPDSRTFVVLLQSLQNLSLSIGFQNSFDAVESIFQSTKQFDEQMQWSKDNGLGPTKKWKPILNVFSYNSLIKTLSKLPTKNSWEESYHSCSRIDDIINEMKSTSSPTTRKDVINCIPNVITAWTKCAEQAGDDKERVGLCANKAGAHTDALLAVSDGGEKRNRSYLIQAINETIALYGRAGMLSKADELFAKAKESNIHNLGTLSTLVDALCEGGMDDIGYVEKARDHLFDFQQKIMGQSFVFPDMKYTSIYNSVIAGFLNCNEKERGAREALNLLTHMVSSHESNPRHIARPNTTSFARVMSGLAQRGDNTQLLEKMLTKMESLKQRRKSVPKNSPDAELVANVAPNIVVYNLLLKAYARLHTEEALRSAMNLLGRMEKDPDVSPDDHSNSYITTLLTCKDKASNIESPVSPPTTKQVAGGPSSTTGINFDIDNLDDLNLIGPNQELTSKSFNSMMNVYATTGTVEGAEKGAALLKKLEEMHSSGEIGFRPDIYLYNKLMNAWHLCEKSNDKDDSISPAEKAQEILDYIIEQCEMGKEGIEHIAPNDVSFSICLHAWCKSNRPDAAERAEQLLRRKELFVRKYEGVVVKATDYNRVISKWKDDPVKGPERATLLFDEVLQRYGDSEEKSRPTAATLNALLDLYAKCHEQDHLAEKAQHYLNRMNQMHKERKSCILPDVISYRSVIDAWILRWHKDSPQKVDALVKEMIEKYRHEGRTDLCPDSNALNLVLKACSHAPAMWKEEGSAEKGNEHPIAIANRIFSMLKGKNQYGANATHATYSFMFLIYKVHMDFRDKRYLPLMKNMWKHCCKDGLVSAFALSTFRDSLLPNDFLESIGGKAKFEKLGKADVKSITVQDLPKEWCRNVSPALKGKGRREKTW